MWFLCCLNQAGVARCYSCCLVLRISSECCAVSLAPRELDWGMGHEAVARGQGGLQCLPLSTQIAGIVGRDGTLLLLFAAVKICTLGKQFSCPLAEQRNKGEKMKRSRSELAGAELRKAGRNVAATYLPPPAMSGNVHWPPQSLIGLVVAER